MTGQDLLSKKLPRKYNNKKTQENPEKKEQVKREPLFVAPENWQHELKTSFTLETAIPPSQEKFLKENKPNFNEVKIQQEKLQQQRGKLIKQISEINQEIKKINNENQFKLESIKKEIQTIREQLEPQVKKQKEIKDSHEVQKEKLNKLKETMDKLVKTFYKEKKWNREKLEEILEQKEDFIKNNKLTATQEKSYLKEIAQIEDTLENMEQLEELQNEYVALQSGVKGVDIKNLSKEVREKFERLKELYNQRHEIKKTMGNPQDEAKKQSINEEELKLIKKKEQIQKQIDSTNVNIQKLFEDYQQQRKHYEQVFFEEHRRNYMLSLQRGLKAEQRKKEQEIYKQKKEIELVEKEKAKIGFLYQDEITKCQQILLFLERYQLINSQNDGEEKEESPEEEITEIDGMKVLAKKGQSQNQQKKTNAKNKKQNKDKAKKNSDGKITLSLQILQEMYQLKIVPPVKEEQIKETVVQIQQKLQDYDLQKKQALEQFNPEEALSKIRERLSNAEEEEETQEKPNKRNNQKRNQRNVESDFPEM